MKFSTLNRSEIVSTLKTQSFDIAIIGGGITGAGIALDAVTRGMKTALLEMQDFSAGTSSRSTKLIHGGLRYLKQFEVKMVAEVGKERAIVYENGPHVTKPVWMLLPIYVGGTFGRLSTSIGLKIYDFLAGVKDEERRKMFSKDETLAHEPLIKQEGLIGSGYYVEYRTDDARLTIEVMKAAHEHGAVALNYTKVLEIIYEDQKVKGLKVKDHLSGETYTIFADIIVNASGPWVDSIRELDRSKYGKILKLSKGVHFVFDQCRFPLKQAVYFDTSDNRMVFAIPRDRKVYVGTTDTFYESDPINPTVQVDDQQYILDAINVMFPTVNISVDDIESSWAGVRPLIYENGKNPSEISRRDEVWESPSGLITIAGGKLTGYRKMAETVVDLIALKLKDNNKTFVPCLTKKLPISGGNVGGSVFFEKYIQNQVEQGINLGLEKCDAINLVEKYGSNTTQIFNLIPECKILAVQYHLPLLLVLQLVYSIQNEMIVSPNDYFFRRSGDLLFNIRSVVKYKDQVIQLMAAIFQWNDYLVEYNLSNLDSEISHRIKPI